MTKATPAQEFGQSAEAYAHQYMRRLGYRVREKNWRTTWGEVDLIVEKNQVLIFVEVKAGRKNDAFSPLDHFTEHKKQKLRSLAQAYVAKQKNLPACQFDLLTLVHDGDRWQLEHFEDVIEDFLP